MTTHSTPSDPSSAQPAPAQSFILFHRTGLEAGTSTLRPFFRRAASTFAPPTLAMRERKPDTRARLRRVPSSVCPFPCFRLHSTLSRKSRATRLTCSATHTGAPATGQGGNTSTEASEVRCVAEEVGGRERRAARLAAREP